MRFFNDFRTGVEFYFECEDVFAKVVMMNDK